MGFLKTTFLVLLPKCFVGETGCGWIVSTCLLPMFDGFIFYYYGFVKTCFKPTTRLENMESTLCTY